jgi:hypothetical protein
MNRYIKIPVLMTGAWFFLSLVPIINLLVLFSLQEIVSWFGVQIGVFGDNTSLAISSIFYGILSIITLVIYFRTAKQWKEAVLGFLFFCFSMTSLFPSTLKRFSLVEPPYVLDFVTISLISGLILISTGQMKVKAVKI